MKYLTNILFLFLFLSLPINMVLTSSQLTTSSLLIDDEIRVTNNTDDTDQNFTDEYIMDDSNQQIKIRRQLNDAEIKARKIKARKQNTDKSIETSSIETN